MGPLANGGRDYYGENARKRNGRNQWSPVYLIQCRLFNTHSRSYLDQGLSLASFSFIFQHIH